MSAPTPVSGDRAQKRKARRTVTSGTPRMMNGGSSGGLIR